MKNDAKNHNKPIQGKDFEKYVEEKLGEMMLNFYSKNTDYEDEKNGCEKIIRQLAKELKPRVSREKIFVQHIENHLKAMGIKGKVICKICGKDIDTIASEAGVEVED